MLLVLGVVMRKSEAVKRLRVSVSRAVLHHSSLGDTCPVALFDG